MRRTFLWINFVLASLIVVGVFLQVGSSPRTSSGRGDGALDAHGVLGGLVIHGSSCSSS